MAIAFNMYKDGGVVVTSPLTFSVTVGTPKPYLFVFIRSDQNNVSVTANGVSMTQTGSTISDGLYESYWWVYGQSGTFNVVATSAGATVVIGYATSYTGAAQQSPEAQGQNSTNASTVAVSVTTLSVGAWVVGGFGGQGFSLDSVTNATFRSPSGAGGNALVDTNGPVSPVGSITLTGNYGGTTNHNGTIIALAPFVTPSVNGGFLMNFL